MEKKTAVIDRIEEGIAVIIPDDGGEIFTCPAKEGFAEGAAVVIEEDGTVRTALPDETKKKNTKEKLKNLFNKNKKD